jgi:hypothetical protein
MHISGLGLWGLARSATPSNPFAKRKAGKNSSFLDTEPKNFYSCNYVPVETGRPGGNDEYFFYDLAMTVKLLLSVFEARATDERSRRPRGKHPLRSICRAPLIYFRTA